MPGESVEIEPLILHIVSQDRLSDDKLAYPFLAVIAQRKRVLILQEAEM